VVAAVVPAVKARTSRYTYEPRPLPPTPVLEHGWIPGRDCVGRAVRPRAAGSGQQQADPVQVARALRLRIQARADIAAQAAAARLEVTHDVARRHLEFTGPKRCRLRKPGGRNEQSDGSHSDDDLVPHGNAHTRHDTCALLKNESSPAAAGSVIGRAQAEQQAAEENGRTRSPRGTRARLW
jgi:hypothetical protein